MRIISEAHIREAKEKWPHAANALEKWRELIKKSHFKDFAALKQANPALDLFKGKNIDLHIFDIGGNKIRIIAKVDFECQLLFIKHVLDHKEYDAGNWKKT
ncbi:hypothetical protein HMPREF1487_09614 [Pseudomonas sp. HPB0071]|uniref:type II toxin-antitoxin system HigB family toxin n=1 Tax=unclassified Pseudomonas TaxID=196821 RepID=UPI0002CA5D72|nr:MULTISPECIES: type II toxin-antitoxin system HigB family toxin [unclassified Pseudomonas]ENA26573.1 hypothetical protein HMPREF1487_09614 [Pseudomonas sp. HPB0071]